MSQHHAGLDALVLPHLLAGLVWGGRLAWAGSVDWVAWLFLGLVAVLGGGGQVCLGWLVFGLVTCLVGPSGDWAGSHGGKWMPLSVIPK